jgi:hypothetical protein
MRSLAHGFYRVTFHTALQYQVSVVSFMAFNFDIVPFLYSSPSFSLHTLFCIVEFDSSG